MNSAQKSVLIANGTFVYNDRIRKLIESADRIVCADGGANHLSAVDVTPDLILGDLDSIHPDTLRRFKDVEIIEKSDQFKTDTMKLIDHELSQGTEELILLGVTGGRIDHTLSNLSLLNKYADLVKISIVDEQAETEFVKNSITFSSILHRKISLMVLGGESSVTSKGLRWELDGKSQQFSSFGISNEVADSPVTIEVDGSGLFLFKIFEMSDGTPLNE